MFDSTSGRACQPPFHIHVLAKWVCGENIVLCEWEGLKLWDTICLQSVSSETFNAINSVDVTLAPCNRAVCPNVSKCISKSVPLSVEARNKWPASTAHWTYPRRLVHLPFFFETLPACWRCPISGTGPSLTDASLVRMMMRVWCQASALGVEQRQANKKTKESRCALFWCVLLIAFASFFFSPLVEHALLITGGVFFWKCLNPSGNSLCFCCRHHMMRQQPVTRSLFFIFFFSFFILLFSLDYLASSSLPPLFTSLRPPSPCSLIALLVQPLCLPALQLSLSFSLFSSGAPTPTHDITLSFVNLSFSPPFYCLIVMSETVNSNFRLSKTFSLWGIHFILGIFLSLNKQLQVHGNNNCILECTMVIMNHLRFSFFSSLLVEL